MTQADVVVVGAGALGLATAAALRLAGRDVVVLAPEEVSASALAAGMLAPAFESALDGMSSPDGERLRHARDLWVDFADQTGVELYRDGAEWRGPEAEAMASRLRDLGFVAHQDGATVFTPEDWRLDARGALAALSRGIARRVGRLIQLEPVPEGWRLTDDRNVVSVARQVVLATGWAPLSCGVSLPPIHPIRGQAVRVSGPCPAHVVRATGVYVVPQGDGGAIIGATMEEGRNDLVPDPDVTARLLSLARKACPELEVAAVVSAYAGVRGASPDGWPYAGLLRPGLGVALAPRRSGWLLAALVAGEVVRALEGRDPGPHAARMSPGRFA